MDILKTLLYRALQPASFAGYLLAGLAAAGYDPSADMKAQLLTAFTGLGGALLIVLDTKVFNKKG